MAVLLNQPTALKLIPRNVLKKREKERRKATYLIILLNAQLNNDRYDEDDENGMQ